MKQFFLGAAAVALVASLAGHSQASTVLYSSSPAEDSYFTTGGLSGAAIVSDPVDSGAAYEITGDPTTIFANAVPTPTFDVSGFVGEEYTVSFDVLLPTGNGFDEFFGFVRFVSDFDDNSAISFTDPDGAGPLRSEFNARIENPSLTGVNFGIGTADRSADLAVLDAWQTVSFTGLIPTVDQDGRPIDLGALSLVPRQADAGNVVGGVLGYVRNVQLSTPATAIPEPSVFGLLATVGLCSTLRRKRA